MATRRAGDANLLLRSYNDNATQDAPGRPTRRYQEDYLFLTQNQDDVVCSSNAPGLVLTDETHQRNARLSLWLN